MWSLENNEQQRAVSYSDYAVRQSYKQAKLTHAVALTESRRFAEATIAWDSLRSGKDSVTAELAARMRDVLTMPATTAFLMSDNDKYAYARYRLSAGDSLKVFELVPTITNDNVKAKTLLDLAQKCYAADAPFAALNILQRMVGIELTDANIGEQMQILELLARVRMGSVPEVIETLKQNPIEFKGKNKKYKIYFDALAAEAVNDSTNANRYYHWLGDDPYFEDGLLAAANYFSNKGLTSYTMLADAVLHHPSSVRLKRAYALEAARNGFDTYAISAATELNDAKLLAEVQQIIKDKAHRP
jgi:hypothetical protein